MNVYTVCFNFSQQTVTC